MMRSMNKIAYETGSINPGCKFNTEPQLKHRGFIPVDENSLVSS